SVSEIAGRDALEVEPRDQLFDALGTTKVRGQDGAREAYSLPCLVDAAVVDTGLLHVYWTDACLYLTLGKVTVPDNHATTIFVTDVRVPLDVLGDLSLDGLGQELLSANSEDLRQRVLR